MSLVTVKATLRDLARGEIPRPNGARTALALRGRWGVGKTHVWKDVVREVSAEPNARRFAYVPLFGLDTPDAVRGALATAVAVDWAPAGRWRRAADLVPKATGALTALVKNVPYMRTLAAAGGAFAEAMAYELVRGAVICLDDLERGGLGPREVFGLVADLRDERGCDVVVIVNDEQLGEGQTAEFLAHGEKALDMQIVLEPTPEEAFEIAFGDWGWPDYAALVEECCVRLGVSNVRVLYRVRSTLEALLPRLAGMAGDTTEGAVRSAVLLTWARHTAEGEAPPYDLVKRPYSHVDFYLRGEEELSDDEKAVRDLRARYGVAVDSKLDQHTAHFVEKGWFDDEALSDTLREVGVSDAEAAARRRVRAAWSIYHGPFGDNEAELISALHAVHIAEVEHVEPGNMDAAIHLLRELDQDELADELIEAYAEAHAGDPSVLRWRDIRVAPNALKDPAFIERLDALASAVPDERTLASVLGELSLKDGWNPGDVEFLASRPSEEYGDYFRSIQDGDLRGLAVRKCLQFGEFRDPHPSYAEVAGRAREALVRIGKSSRLDKMRVERGLGVPVDEPVQARAETDG